ncbi:tetratricopeptide repeat protein [Archangium primigenium]|uniref:tetratricopeptide repeat protein n=1 Tax=[Archangium] primigenium TaxID=2792470 RepID=UPI0019564309|nr:tetratricopeptide repeat protein [Archangium primigenium]MBM7117989.1 tetratricopeptide repeat protein [Archangium primigenium]
MSNSPSKTLSPAELAKLEHAFASDPSSEAYKPLAEAYLASGRFMEAMVVCKKGVKAHPNRADPRLLLARVYQEQGKDKKALEEALGALQAYPSDRATLRMVGALQLKTGEADAGRTHLLKAYEADPADPDTLAVMKQHGVQAAAPAPTPAPVVAAPAPTPAPVVAAPAPTPAPVAATPAPGAEAETPRAKAPAAEAAPRAPVRRAPVVEEDVDDDDAPRKPRKQGTDKGKFITLGLLVAVPVILGGYFIQGRAAATRNREIKRQLDIATQELKHDSFASYQAACKAADTALNADPDSTAAHGYLAYAYAIRWGEHGGGDDARKKAEEHLAAAQKSGEISSHLYAAEALVKTYGGKGKEALADLEKRVQDFDKENKRSSLLYLTLGLIQMNAGDMDRAKDNLEKAQGLSPDDPRIYAALGAVYRRLGQDGTAWKNYDFALRYEKDHPESLLGKSLLMLEQDEANFEPNNFGLAAVMLKKLLEVSPPPSPRQLAAANVARSLLISRVSKAMEKMKPEDQAKLSEATGVPTDKEKARQEMAKAEDTGFTLDRNSPELYLIKGRRLISENQYDLAATEIRKAVKMDATRAQFYVELAKALMGKPGGEKEASEALVTAIKTMGDSPKLLTMLGNAYRRQGKLDDALATYQRSVKDANAKNPEARLAIGAIYRERGSWDLAQDSLEKASTEYIGQSDKAATALLELARVFEGKGDATKADETYQKALNADENYAPAYYYYAAFLSKDKKQATKAKALAQEYVKREPKGEFVARAQAL